MANVLKRLDRKIFKATRRALSKGITKVNKAMAQRVRRVYNIRASALKKNSLRSKDNRFKSRVVVVRPGRQRLESSIVVKGLKIPLDRFVSGNITNLLKRNKKGRAPKVRTRVNKTKGRKVVKGGFVGLTKNSDIPTIFVRTGGKSRTGARELKRLYTLSVAQMYGNSASNTFEDVSKKDIPALVKSETRKEFSK